MQDNFKKKITKNTGEYRVPVDTPIKKTKVTSIAMTLYSSIHLRNTS